MLVFVDESGDLGFKFETGSSPYFVVAMVIFDDDDEAQVVDDKIAELRQELRLDPRYEFHFNKCSHRFRSKFLTAVAPYSFYYYAMVMNKQRLWSQRFRDKTELYSFTSGLVFDNAKALLVEARVKIDQSGSKEFQKQLARYLKKQINTPGQHSIKSVKPQESANNNLLQLADMITGAVSRSFGTKADRETYRGLIQHREKRVQLWPP